MCWTTEIGFHAEEQVATEPVPIIKIGIIRDSNKVSGFFYKRFIYEFGIPTEPIELEVEDSPQYSCIEKGYHGYRNDYLLDEVKVYTNGYNNIIVSNQHGISDSYPYIPNICKIIGYIPPGAKYYCSYNGYIVASQVVIKDAIPL